MFSEQSSRIYSETYLELPRSEQSGDMLVHSRCNRSPIRQSRVCKYVRDLFIGAALVLCDLDVRDDDQCTAWRNELIAEVLGILVRHRVVANLKGSGRDLADGSLERRCI